MTSAAGRRRHTRSSWLDVTEIAATAAAGAALAGGAWSVVGLATPAAIVGGANGAIAGGRRIYRWRSASGWLAFLLDSTWALVTTASALAVHAVAASQRLPGNYVVELSERRDRHVYVKGYAIRRGFLFTVGNVVSGAGPNVRRNVLRRRIVTDHEHVHVWQTRWFGPIFPAVYVAWTVGGALGGAVVWLARFVRRRSDRSVPADHFGKVVETWSYYCNPFEWWAYSRQGHWPPSGAAPRLVWRRQMVRSFGDREPAG